MAWVDDATLALATAAGKIHLASIELAKCAGFPRLAKRAGRGTFFRNFKGVGDFMKVVWRQNLFRAILTSVILWGLAPQVSAEALQPASAEPVTQLSVTQQDEPVLLPDRGTMGDRSWVQLVWNELEKRVERQRFVLRDGLFHLDLDVSWEPDSQQFQKGGLVNGTGTVIYRERGGSAYDREAKVASLTGHFVDGALTGEGIYRHRSGVLYEGGWKDGLMDGIGRLSLPNGDQYTGAFSQGKLNGTGTYIDATGSVYDGAYVNGVRQGRGDYYPSTGQAPFHAIWKQGKAEPDTISSIAREDWRHPPIVLAQQNRTGDLKVGVAVDQGVVASLDTGDFPIRKYKAVRLRDRVILALADQGLVHKWQKNGELARVYEYSLEEDYEKGVPILLSFENRTGAPVRVVRTYLDVIQSQTNLEPALYYYTEGDHSLDIPREDGYVDARLYLGNYGWSPARNSTLTYRFGDDRTDTMKRLNLGALSQETVIDFRQELIRRGVRIDILESRSIACNKDYEPEPYKLTSCLVNPGDKNIFGGFLDLLKVDFGRIKLELNGALEYEWIDQNNNVMDEARKLNVSLIIGKTNIAFEPEGEGGTPEEVRASSVRLKLDQSGYRIPIPLSANVASGLTGRWRIWLNADKASNHLFRVVFETARGERISSTPVEFQFVKFNF